MAPVQFCFYLLLFFHISVCFEPFSTTTILGLVGGIASIAGYWKYGNWKSKELNQKERCDNSWIEFKYSGLQQKFHDILHGQPIAENIILTSLARHVAQKHQPKALVLSFHGTTGVGKNFVSQLIAEHLYKKGMDSSFVHLYITTIHFPHKNHVIKYRNKLKREVEEAINRCSQSLFIFDEFDKMPEGIIDVLEPYVNYEKFAAGHKQSIFLFLSNSGGEAIAETTYEALFVSNRQRYEIALAGDFDKLFDADIFKNEVSPDHNKYYTHKYVPFLPLERHHVAMCVRDVLRMRPVFSSMRETIVDKVLNEITFYSPPNAKTPGVFAASGCKRIDQKVDLYIDW